jgi:hypothetical protein
MQLKTYIKINSINVHYKFKNSNSLNRQIYLEKQILSYQNSDITTLQFVKLASHYYAHICTS